MLRFMGSQRIGATELNRVTWVLEPGRNTLETGNALMGREKSRGVLSPPLLNRRTPTAVSGFPSSLGLYS